MPIRSTYMSLGNYLHWVAICDRLEHLVSQGHARFATRKWVNLMKACQCLNATVPWFLFGFNFCQYKLVPLRQQVSAMRLVLS